MRKFVFVFVMVFFLLSALAPASLASEPPASVPPSPASTPIATDAGEERTTYPEGWIEGGSGDSLLETLFGPYTPYNAEGAASIDFAWIADVVLFGLILFCILKLFGGIIRNV